jgi:hypothetical protein
MSVLNNEHVSLASALPESKKQANADDRLLEHGSGVVLCARSLHMVIERGKRGMDRKVRLVPNARRLFGLTGTVCRRLVKLMAREKNGERPRSLSSFECARTVKGKGKFEFSAAPN